jgi:hypothetical protein
VFRNREGDRVDPVPFLVVVGFAFLGSFTFVPVYCLSLGLSTVQAAGIAIAVFSLLTAAAYRRMVWGARPDLAGEIPAGERLIRLYYGALVVGGVLLGLTVLLLSR